MQIVQRDQAQPEDLFGLDEMTNVPASEFAATGTGAVFFDWFFIQRKLGIF